MKKIIFILTVFFALVASEIYAQDIIVLKTGEEILSEVVKIDIHKIEYKKYENLGGPIYILQKVDIFMIKYENGSKDVFNTKTVVSETKPTYSSTQQIVFGEETEKVDNFDFIIGANLGVGFMNGSSVEEVYSGETHFKILIGPRIKKANLFLFYERTTSNGHPLDEDGNQYEEFTSKMNLNIIGIQASFGNVFYIGPRLASVTIKESFEFMEEYVSAETSGILIGLNLGLQTKTKFQFFGEINLDYFNFDTNELDEGALVKEEGTFIRGSVNLGFRLRL